MLKIKGDIWKLRKLPEFAPGWIIIPTNIGWKSNGSNVMGRGLAKQAAVKYPWIPRAYGEYLRNMYKSPVGGIQSIEVPVSLINPSTAYSDIILFPNTAHSNIILFPTKELNAGSPHLSWRNKSSLSLISRGIDRLNKIWPENLSCLVPLLGCGNGGLNPDDVLPIMSSLDDRFTLVEL